MRLFCCNIWHEFAVDLFSFHHLTGKSYCEHSVSAVLFNPPSDRRDRISHALNLYLANVPG